MKVLFINCVCSNSGDAAIFQAASAVLRRAFGPDTEFLVQDDHPQRVRKLYPYLNFVGSCYWRVAYTDLKGWRGSLIRWLRLARFRLARWLLRTGHRFSASRLLSQEELNYLKAYQAADLIVATGGTYLVENYNIDQRVFDMTTAVAIRRPLVLFTQSASPFSARHNRRRLRRIFQAARLILLRDHRSRDHIRDLGVSEDHLRMAPDAAFALADDDLATRPNDPFPLKKTSPRIAISVRRWDYFVGCSNQEGMTRYCDSFISLITHLVKTYNAEVVFLSTCQGVPGYHDDSRVASEIWARLSEEIQHRVSIDGAFRAPNELRERFREFDWVVATRMHVAILALGVAIPVLPIAYEFKTNELFKSLGYEGDVLDIEMLTPENLISAFETAVGVYGRAARKIHAAVDRHRHAAWQVSDILQEKLPELVGTTHKEPTPQSSPCSVPANLQTVG
jgi:colanic acid/amylovoran biosynthesis protein